MAGFKKNITISATDWLKDVFFTRRMQSVPGIVVMVLIGIGLAWSGNQYGVKTPLMIND